MEIEDEKRAKAYYISSDIEGIHTPRTNTVELNQLDLYKLMHGYAKSLLPKEEEKEEECKCKMPSERNKGYLSNPFCAVCGKELK